MELAHFQPALQAVLQEMGAAFIEKHPAFLVNERLQELELRFGQLDLCGERSHGHVRGAPSDLIRNLAEHAVLRSACAYRASLKWCQLRAGTQHAQADKLPYAARYLPPPP